MSAVPDLLADFLALERLLEAQPEGTNVEVVRGVWLLAPRPRFRHGRSAVRLASLLEAGPGPPARTAPAPTGSSSSSRRSAPSSLSLASSPTSPAGGGRRAAGRGRTNRSSSSFPDWVAEVVSPSTEGVDRGRKCEAYGLMGVAWYWIVDPEKRTVDVFTNVRGRMVPERSLGPDDPLCGAPVPAARRAGRDSLPRLTRAAAAAPCAR